MNATYQQKKFLGNNQGFTLLEVMISLGILVLILGSILTVQSSSLKAAVNAKEMNTVAMLARNIMVDTETKLYARNFNEVSKTTDGAFESPYQDYKWKVEIKEVEFPRINFNPAAAGGAANSGGDTEGPTAIVDQIVKVITNYLSKSIREVQVTITWKRGDTDMNYTVSTYWVNLNEEFTVTG